MSVSLGSEQKKKNVQPVTVIVVAVLVVIVAVVLFSRKNTFKPVVAGAPASDFTLPDLEGNPVSLQDFRGRVVFLNFWATWCKPCEDEMPSMQAIQKSLGSQPFDIIAISLDTGGVEKVKEFVEKHNLTFTILHDRRGKIKELYKTTGVPETFIIDQNGIIAEKIWGPRDWTKHSNLSTIVTLLQNPPEPVK